MNKQTRDSLNEMTTATRKEGRGFSKAAQSMKSFGTVSAAEVERCYVAAGRPYDFYFIDGDEARGRWFEGGAWRY